MPRALVVEHRITEKLGPWTVRYWIESDVAHGGTRSHVEAKGDVIGLHEFMKPALEQYQYNPATLAVDLLQQIRAANSVEVCDSNGNGACAHKDWP